ncbi:unnamed protein product [Rotaria sp. Silwood1]|nr:unnamed protein product [Rotaria sp. Silwood1]
MSNLKESINENVNVPQGETAVCQNTITTDPLGPCLFVLIRCLRKERRLCLLYHHDFNKYDDSGKPQLIILKEFLMMICDGFKTDLGMTSLIPNCPPGNSGVKECLLAIGGGEIYEAEQHNTGEKLDYAYLEFQYSYLPRSDDTVTLRTVLRPSLGTLPQLERLNEIRSMIPSNALYINPEVGINRFSRIDQLIFRCAIEESVEVAAINDPFIPVDYMAYLVQYDSTYGKFKDAEYIVELTGVFTTIDQCQSHLQAGAKKVVITVSSADVPR